MPAGSREWRAAIRRLKSFAIANASASEFFTCRLRAASPC